MSAVTAITTGLNVAGSLFGASKQADAAGDASALMAQVAQEQIDLQRDIYQQNRSDLSPFLDAGAAATNALMARLGFSQPANADWTAQYGSPVAQNQPQQFQNPFMQAIYNAGVPADQVQRISQQTTDPTLRQQIVNGTAENARSLLIQNGHQVGQTRVPAGGPATGPAGGTQAPEAPSTPSGPVTGYQNMSREDMQARADANTAQGDAASARVWQDRIAAYDRGESWQAPAQQNGLDPNIYGGDAAQRGAGYYMPNPNGGDDIFIRTTGGGGGGGGGAQTGEQGGGGFDFSTPGSGYVYDPSADQSARPVFDPSGRFTTPNYFNYGEDVTARRDYDPGRFAEANTFTPSNGLLQARTFTPGREFTRANRFGGTPDAQDINRFTPRDEVGRYNPFRVSEDIRGKNEFTPGSEFTDKVTLSREELEADPSYQFRKQQAMEELERSARASGISLSGSALLDLEKRASDLASTEYAAAFGRKQSETQRTYGVQQDIYGARASDLQRRFGVETGEYDRNQSELQRLAGVDERAFGLNEAERAARYSRALQSYGADANDLARRQQLQQYGFEQDAAERARAFGRQESTYRANAADLARQQELDQYTYQAGVAETARQGALQRDQYLLNMGELARLYGVESDVFNSQVASSDASWQRLAAMAGIGLPAANSTVGAANTYGNNVNSIAGGSATDQANALLAGAGAWGRGMTGATNAVNSGINNYLFNQNLGGGNSWGADFNQVGTVSGGNNWGGSSDWGYM